MLFKLMTLVHLCAAFPLKCPEAAQWRLRANSHCADSSKYLCLWDDNIKEYSENCTRFDFQKAGRKSVLRGGIDADECSKERYQPSGYTLYTNASTNCILLKSFCNEEGQVVYDHGNSTTDATCVCNYRRGFAFLIKPNNPCYCKPSQEDCSCFLKICSNSSHILSPDYKCTIDSDLPPVSNCRAITDENDNNGRRPNITETFPREDNYVTVPWRKRSAIAVSSIFGCTMVMLLLLWMKRVRGHCTQCCIREIFTSEFIPISCIEGERLQLKCSVYSKDISVKWMKDDMEIEQSENLSIYIDGKDHFLIVQQAKLSDSGQYFMIARNVEKQQTVTIKAMFTSTLDPIKCIEGEKLQLKCSVYLEHVSVEWFKADVRFNENENISIENDGIHHCMTIQQAKLSDDGQYDISAGNVRKQVTVHVQAMFTSELDPIKCIEGEKLQLKCSVYLEDASVEWLKGDVRINENENISIECDGMHHCMTIIPAKLSDDGQYDIVAGNVRKQVRVNVQGRTKLEEAKQEKESSQKKALCNWKLLKEILASINIEDVSKQLVGKDIWERIKHNSRRSQLETILRTAIKNIQTSADYDQFEAKVFNFNSNFRLLTPNNNLFPVDTVMANQLLPANTELIENELYPKDHIDSFLEWLIFSLIEHEELRNMENVREKVANSFLTKIQLPNYIKKGSMHCLLDCFRRVDNKVLNRISELMDSALSNGSSNFTGDNTLKKIMETRNFCRHSIICKWTYLKENFDPLDIIVNLYRCRLVDEDRAEIMRRKSRREMVDLTLRNIVRRIDGQIMLSKLKDILKEVNLSLTDEQQDIAERNRFGEENNCDVENVKSRLQTLKNDLESQFDPNYIDTFLENNIFDIDDHENIWEAGSGERGKCFYEKISDIEYIKKGSIKCLAYCLENSEDSPVIKKLLAGLLTSDEMPEQEIKRTETHIEIGTEIMYSRNTNTLTQASITIKTDPGIENGMFEGANSEKINKTISGLQMEIKDTERSSVIFHLQSSDGENVKLVFEKGISNGNLTSFIKNLLNDENVKKHMSPDKRYNLSVSIHSEDQQTQLCSDHDKLKMRIIKANRKLLEEEYDPMSLLKALFDGNQGNYKSLKNLSLEDVADFKQKFSEINKIPERRKRVKQFLNIAEDMIEADKLWELIEDTANTFSMKKMQHDLKSEQNYNSSSDEGLIFEGKYEVWKTEEDVKSPLQSFILQESKKRVLPEAINRLPEKYRNRYIELMQSTKVEKRYFVRIMIVGKETVGKTSLVRRLLKEEKIDDVNSTDGLDIVVHRCRINIDDGKWMIGKFTSDDRGDRIHRAVKKESIKHDMPTNISHEQFNTSSVIASTDEFKNIEVQVNNRNDIDDTATLSDLETSTPMLKKRNEHLTDEEDSCLDNVSMATHDTKDNDQTLETIGKIEDEGNIKDNENDINNDTKDISIENKDTKKSLALVMPLDLLSHVFSKTSTSNIPSNHYALCGLWDFAGQKDFYATHQTFLTSSAIYLVVADMADDIFREGKKHCFEDFQNVGEYVDYWFDTIHCHRTIEQRVNESFNDHIDPPIILVFTGKDKYEKDKKKRKTDLQTQLDKVLGYQSKYHHLRSIFCLSNTTDHYNEFEKLQDEISTIARGMKSWGEAVPLKWILLEHLIEINKNNGKNFINLSEMTDLAKHSAINILDIEDVKLFLCFQHEVGSLIYFEDIQDFIILKPKWLVDAFRCLVSDRINDKLQHCTDSTKCVQNGQISESLILELFKSKCGSQFSDQIGNLLTIMEKFDILVKIDKTSSYIVPSMMPYLSFSEVCEQVGLQNQNKCKRTSWLCLKFSFLPPAFFNHVSVWFIRKYIKSENKKQSMMLSRRICVFDIDQSGCTKLLVTMSTDTIAIQLLSFSSRKPELESICVSIRKDLVEKIKAIKERYKLTLYYELHFKCSTGKYYDQTISYKTLKCSPEYQCEEHQEAHQSKEIYLPWMMNAEEDMRKIRSAMEIELTNAANRFENLGASIETLVEEEEPKPESNINQQAKTVDDNFKKATAEKTSSIAGENNIATMSQEDENYVRMRLLLYSISPRAVRKLFDSEFNPTVLDATFQRAYSKLKDLKIKRIINLSQWNLLFPHNGRPDSNSFDVTLMITLLTNLTRLNKYKQFPLKTNTSPGADLERIKYYRNLISHNIDGNIDTSFFSTAWNDIAEAIGRLGGQHMLVECNELRTKKIEQSTVPWNKRAIMNHELEEWKSNSSSFVETRASKHVIECIHKHSCVTITASAGVGKTATLRHVALEMADEGYDVLLVQSPHDILKFNNPNQKTLFVIDDFCGTYSINHTDLYSLELVMDHLKVMIQNKFTKIIVACRLQVYQDNQFESLVIFRTCVCNLLSEDFCLTQIEKLSIAKLYLKTKATEIMQYCDLFDCFPLICKLSNDNPTLNIIDFFKNPFSIYEYEIDTLYKSRNNGKYCVLALCVMFNNSLKEQWLTDEIDTEIRRIIKNTCEACKLHRGTSRLVLLDELKTLEHTFIKKKQGVYTTIHNKIFDFLSFYFGKNMIQCLIRHGDSELIMQRYSLERKDDTDQFITIVPPKYHQMYMQRMIGDWSKGILHCVFNNINMKIPEFRQKFLRNLNTLDFSVQKQLALTRDVSNKDTVLLQCCQYDDTPLIQWCINHGIDVNQCNYKGMSPLYISAQEGLTRVVMLLLDNKADINKCTDDGASPLCVACQKNHKEIVKLLLDKKAVIHNGMDDATSPLLIAKKMNHTVIVRMLEENGSSE